MCDGGPFAGDVNPTTLFPPRLLRSKAASFSKINASPDPPETCSLTSPSKPGVDRPRPSLTAQMSGRATDRSLDEAARLSAGRSNRAALGRCQAFTCAHGDRESIVRRR